MKFLVAFAMLVAVASARVAVTAEEAQIQEVIAAINSPSTDPATAAALEQLLLDILGVEPVAVGPAIVEAAPGPIVASPIFIQGEKPIASPVIVDFPLTETGEAIVDPSPVIVPAPVAAAPAASSAPLVQIILNINQAAAESSPVAVSPVVIPDIVDSPLSPVQVIEAAPVSPVQVVETAPVSPVQVVDITPISPVQVVETAPISPVQVVETAPISPVQVIETAPVPVAPVIIGTPVIPAPAVNLPEELN